MNNDQKLNLLWLPRDNKGCGFYRMLMPANWIMKKGLANVKISNGWNMEEVKWANVIIIQRPSDWQAYDAIEEAKSMGKKIVFEIDDLLQLVNPNNYAYEYWTPIGANLGRSLNLMKLCNAVTTTTPRLANEYALFNRRMFVIPNYLDPDLWNQPKSWSTKEWNDYYKRKNDDIIRIGWTGAASHRQDLEMISGIITKLCKKYKNVQFSMLGFTPKEIFSTIPLREGTCPHCGAEGQLEADKGVPVLEYPDKLKSMAFDIGIAPIIETGFNECKSDLKLKEYAAIGVPVVASNIKPYSESLKDGVGKRGYLASNGKDWYNYLEMLILDKDLRERLGKNNRRWYEENTIDKHIYKWIEVYKELVDVKFNW